MDDTTALGATVHGLYVVKEGSNPWGSASLEAQDERADACARRSSIGPRTGR